MQEAPPDDYRDRLERAKRASLAQVLSRCARLVQARARARLRAHPGMEALRDAHLQLFPHIDLEGTRLTELAARLGVSKQAAGQLVAELEAMGVVEKLPDPDDGRARLITFTDRGKAGILEGLGLLGAVEVELHAELGAARFEALHAGLLDLLDLLEPRSGEDKK